MPWKTKRVRNGFSYKLTYYSGEEIEFFPCNSSEKLSETVRITIKKPGEKEIVFQIPKRIVEDFLQQMH
jgi:hypothetical protein